MPEPSENSMKDNIPKTYLILILLSSEGLPGSSFACLTEWSSDKVKTLKGKKQSLRSQQSRKNIWISWLKEHQEFTMSKDQKIKCLQKRNLIIFSDRHGNFHNVKGRY